MQEHTHRPNWFAIVALLVVGFLIGANTFHAGRAATPAAAGAQQSDVTLKELSISPATIQLQPRMPAVLHVRNTGQALHSLVVDVGGRTLTTPLVGPGNGAELRLPALAAGSYKAWCSVPGHRDAGMTATVQVGAAAGSAGGNHAAMAGMSGMSGDATGTMSPQQIMDMHKQSMTAFPARTAGQGAQPLAPTLDHGVKVFHLTAMQARWETTPGQFQDAFTYNGTVPGPELRVHRGDRVRIVLDNRLPQATVIHFHGVTVPNADDGVPYVTQDPVLPGKRFTYEFTVVDQPGTYMYHSHFNSTEQVGRGLFGPLVVEPAKPGWDVAYTEMLSDGPLGYAIDGKGWPATAPLVARRGQKVLIRLTNAGQMLHPLHLHGYHFRVLAQDGAAVRQPYDVDTLVVAPGETFDVLVNATNPGVWAFHCHILSHVEGEQGMFGMATALVVK
jgi:manganese oxidase